LVVAWNERHLGMEVTLDAAPPAVAAALSDRAVPRAILLAANAA
jgi:hypothetical protein